MSDEIVAQQMQEEILKTKAEGDSLGGIIHCVIKNVPVGLGEPVFDKLQADLAKAIFSINAVHGFEYGSGFAGSAMKGSEHNDAFEMKLGIPYTKSNFSGGIQGVLVMEWIFISVPLSNQQQQSVKNNQLSTLKEKKFYWKQKVVMIHVCCLVQFPLWKL